VDGLAIDGVGEISDVGEDSPPGDGGFTEQELSDMIDSIPVDSIDDDMSEHTLRKFHDTAADELPRFKDPDVARNTFGTIGEVFVNDFRTGINFQAGKSKDSSSFEIQPASRPNTFHHEYGHALADGYGWGISPEAAREGSVEYDSSEDNFVPVDLSRDDIDEFKLTSLEGETPPPEVEQLFEAVNDAWETAQEVGQESPGDLEDYVPKTNYGMLNAHEYLAQLHESLQSDTLPNNANWFYRYDDLLPSYLEVFEPSDRLKELITYLHNNRDGSPFDSDPYPDIEPEV
jgi:hypothetical protein